ncbi:thermonuclease family protein [Novosphingobium percolationis]|uniref:thermonuclease family protein n=1 Tax=Novosphingobium percolationis TaxID=2871811 RepID=UPI001CD52D1C|nr:thermonuclease family protein [Novosphingobium percolationis]
MPMLTFLASAALCASPAVHDGDTIRCGAERIRIANIDAPELPDSPKCQDYRRAYAWCDYRAGNRARIALQGFLRGGSVKVQRLGTDKYGRMLARVTVNGKDAGDYLVRLGLAREWR